MHDEDDYSTTERRFLGLLDAGPGVWQPSEQIDWIHNPDLVVRLNLDRQGDA